MPGGSLPFCFVALVFLNVRDVVSRAQRSADGSNVVVFHGVLA